LCTFAKSNIKINKMNIRKLFIGAVFLYGCLIPCTAQDYDVVTITIKASSYDKSLPPSFAKVKYNKLCPLVITSDDMGAVELIRNWAFFNGYPTFGNAGFGHVPMGEDFLDTPYNLSALSFQEASLKNDGHKPLTYSDGTGGIRRFTATSAIWPHQADKDLYTLIDGIDAKTMIRTGWSFAQHDVDGEYTTDAQTIAARFKELSEKWEEYTGIGLKVMVEPNGDHKYIDAGKMSDEICWNIFQNGVVGTYPEMKDILISDWAGGKDWTSFNQKPSETTRRIFFQGNGESEFINEIKNADGTKIILGGTHGIGDNILLLLKDLDREMGTAEKKDQFWVASADEVWEYYHLYNNATITDINYNENSKELSFKVNIPKYKKNQFRELTINIPGISDGTDCSFSENVSTGSAKQNDGQYTINFGIEDKIYSYIEELTTYYRKHFYNTYVKEDVQYLIDRLKDGQKKDAYQAALDKEPEYSYTVKANLGNVLISGISDEANQIEYTFPKFILDNSELYITQPNTSVPYYANSFTPEGKGQVITIDYEKLLNNVVYYSEGEALEGADYNPIHQENIHKNGTGEQFVYRNASNGAAGIINKPTTIVTLQPGTYKIVACAGDSWNSIPDGRTATFTFKTGDKTLYTFQTDITGVKEFSKEDITIKEESILTLEATGCGVSRWLDYLYIQKTSDYDDNVPDVTITATSTERDATTDMSPITITATSQPKGDATISKTVIKDAQGQEVASADGSACTFEFIPQNVGDIAFTAEATDNKGGKGVSDDLVIKVKSDFTVSAKSSLGDLIVSETFNGQTERMEYTLLYPRFILKDAELYEAVPNSTRPHFGEHFTINLDNKNIDKVINYEKAVSDVVFYSEAESLEGDEVKIWTTDFNNIGQDKGESYALNLCSNGKAASFNNLQITSLPVGKYFLTAGIGATNGNSMSTYTFALNNEPLFPGVSAPEVTNRDADTYQYISKAFEVKEDNSNLSVISTINNSSNWFDYIFIVKGEPTGISNQKASYKDGQALYNMMGMKVDKGYKGIVIKGGKKYVVK